MARTDISSNFTVGDFNGDGLADLAVPADNRSGLVAILVGKGDGAFQRTDVTLPNPNSGALHCISTQDVNADGKSDLVFVADHSGYDEVWVLYGKGDGSFENLTSLGLSAYDVTRTLIVSDLDHDGRKAEGTTLGGLYYEPR